MNTRLFIKTFLSTTIVLCAIAVLAFSITERKTNTPTDEIENKIVQNASDDKNVPEMLTLSHYLVKLENGAVEIYEVFSDNSKVHAGTLDIPVDTLREIDKLSFEHGIVVKDASDILHIAEDFSS